MKNKAKEAVLEAMREKAEDALAELQTAILLGQSLTFPFMQTTFKLIKTLSLALLLTWSQLT